MHAGRGSHPGTRPLAAVSQRGDPAVAPRPGGWRIAGADGDPERVRRGAVLRRGYLHHRHLPHLVRPRRAGRRRPAGRLPAGLRDRPGAAGALVAGQAPLLPHLQSLPAAAGVPARRLGLGGRLPGLPAADPGWLPDSQRYPRRAGHRAGRRAVRFELHRLCPQQPGAGQHRRADRGDPGGGAELRGTPQRYPADPHRHAHLGHGLCDPGFGGRGRHPDSLRLAGQHHQHLACWRAVAR